tara:strand:+ start:186 stop:458 length:273 start_codon:yes stop_codon:yes gene_type:complete
MIDNDTIRWKVVEEMGELAQALSKDHRKPTKRTKRDLSREYADVCFWLRILRNSGMVDMQEVYKKSHNREEKEYEFLVSRESVEQQKNSA